VELIKLNLVCAIASAAMLGIADAIEALWLALLWVTETLLAASCDQIALHFASFRGNAGRLSLSE
jgi:hypothetical protein